MNFFLPFNSSKCTFILILFFVFPKYTKNVPIKSTRLFNVYASHIEQPLPQFPPQQQRRSIRIIIHEQSPFSQFVPPTKPLPHPPQQKRRMRIQSQLPPTELLPAQFDIKYYLQIFLLLQINTMRLKRQN